MNMGLAIPAFATAFNALLWLSRAALSPHVAPRAGGVAGWLVALIAPLSLLGIALRLDLAPRDRLLFVAAASVALAALLSGL